MSDKIKCSWRHQAWDQVPKTRSIPLWATCNHSSGCNWSTLEAFFSYGYVIDIKLSLAMVNVCIILDFSFPSKIWSHCTGSLFIHSLYNTEPYQQVLIWERGESSQSMEISGCTIKGHKYSFSWILNGIFILTMHK
jgi:hypothetical protein